MARKTRKNVKHKHRRKSCIQNHHITYDPPWEVQVWSGEHECLWKVQRRKRFSKGFIVAMRFELERAEKVAVDLSNPSMIPKKANS